MDTKNPAANASLSALHAMRWEVDQMDVSIREDDEKVQPELARALKAMVELLHILRTQAV